MDMGLSSALIPARDGVTRGRVLWSTTTEAVDGRISAKAAQGSDFRGSSAPLRLTISYLYLSPALAPGTKISHQPLPRTRMACRRPSHRLKSPTTLTRRAFGAQTTKATPCTPSISIGCAPSLS